MNDDLDLKRDRIAKYARWVGAGAICFFVSPVIFAVVKGAAGLFVAGVLGLALVNFMPYLAMVFANWKLKAIKFEASKNPIETLENDYARRKQRLGEMRQSILTSKASVANYGSKLQTFKQKFPADAQTFDDGYTKMLAALKIKGDKYQLAKADLARFADVIERASAIWEMTKDAAAASKAVDSVDDFYREVARNTALDAVQKSLNMTFADLGEHVTKRLNERDRGQDKRVLDVVGKLLPATISPDYALGILRRVRDGYGERVRTAKAIGGDDTKALAHSFRVGYQLRHLFADGDFSYPLPESGFLRDVKYGRLRYHEDHLDDRLNALITEVEAAAVASTLPEKVDQAWLDSIVLTAYA